MRLESATEGVLSGRVASWRTLVDWISSHPWQTVIGIGYKTLPYTDYLGSAVVSGVSDGDLNNYRRTYVSHGGKCHECDR